MVLVGRVRASPSATTTTPRQTPRPQTTSSLHTHSPVSLAMNETELMWSRRPQPIMIFSTTKVHRCLSELESLKAGRRLHSSDELFNIQVRPYCPEQPGGAGFH